MDTDIIILEQLKSETGIFTLNEHPEQIEIADTLFKTIALEYTKDIISLKKIYGELFDIFKKYENRLDYVIALKPEQAKYYLNSVFTLQYEELTDFGYSKQNFSVGFFLFNVANLLQKGITVFRDESDERVAQKLVNYLEAIEYWQDKDYGVWNTTFDFHISSVGACVAGLKKISLYLDVSKKSIDKGEEALKNILNETREVDLALLSLMYPFEIIPKRTVTKILRNIEKKLVKKYGVLKNERDKKEYSFGFPYLALVYKKLGDKKKYRRYMYKTEKVRNKNGSFSEYWENGVWSNTTDGLAHALSIAAYLEKHIKISKNSKN